MNLFAGQEQRHRHREQTCGHSGRWEGWDELGDQDWHVYTTMCKTDSQREPAVQHRELSLVLCDDLDGWDGGGGEREVQREGIYVYIQLIRFIVQQKLTQHCKAATVTTTPLKKKAELDFRGSIVIPSLSVTAHSR